MNAHFQSVVLARPTKIDDTPIKHVVAECVGVLEEKLDHTELVRMVEKLCEVFGLHIVKQYEHRFSPFGSTIVFVLEESHIAIHTWPENGYMHCDFVTCTPEYIDGSKLKDFLDDRLSPTGISIIKLKY